MLEQMAKHNPDTEDIYEDNLLDTHYPLRPESLEDICLYDLWPITIGKVEMMMETESTPSSKSHVFLTTNFDPQKENQRKTISTL